MKIDLPDPARYHFPMKTFHGEDFLINKAMMADLPDAMAMASDGAGVESGHPRGTIRYGQGEDEERPAVNGSRAADELTTNQNSWMTPPQPMPARASLPASLDGSLMSNAGRMAPAVTADGWNRRRGYIMSLSVENRMRLLFNKPLLPSDCP